MASAKSGKAIKTVKPAKPAEPEEADEADPGKVEAAQAEQRQTKKGKYGSTPAKPFKPPTDEEKAVKTGWIEIELVDMEDEPVPGAAYEIKLPDGSVASGTLDAKGFARVEGFESGQCEISFPELDQDAWEPA